MEYGEVLHFAFSWRKSLGSLKYVALLWLLVLALLAVLSFIAYVLFKDVFLSLLSGNYGSIEVILANPKQLGQMMISFLFTAAPAFVFFVILCFFAKSLVSLFALKKLSLEVPPFSIQRAFILFFTAVAVPIFALLSWYNKRVLLLPLFAIIFAFSTFIPVEAASIGGIVLSGLLFLVYAFAFIYNCLRLCFATTVFLHKNNSMSEALEESWQLTHGKIWPIILAFAIAEIILAIASAIAGIALITAISFAIVKLFPGMSFFKSFFAALFISLFLLYPFQILSWCFAKTAIYSNLIEKKEEE
jgi:hypothetical protein